MNKRLPTILLIKKDKTKYIKLQLSNRIYIYFSTEAGGRGRGRGGRVSLSKKSRGAGGRMACGEPFQSKDFLIL